VQRDWRQVCVPTYLPTYQRTYLPSGVGSVAYSAAQSLPFCLFLAIGPTSKSVGNLLLLMLMMTMILLLLLLLLLVVVVVVE
jgi:hypothetical protein